MIGFLHEVCANVWSLSSTGFRLSNKRSFTSQPVAIDNTETLFLLLPERFLLDGFVFMISSPHNSQARAALAIHILAI